MSAEASNAPPSKGMADLDLLGQDLMQQSLPKDIKILPQDTGYGYSILQRGVIK